MLPQVRLVHHGNKLEFLKHRHMAVGVPRDVPEAITHVNCQSEPSILYIALIC